MVSLSEGDTCCWEYWLEIWFIWLIRSLLTQATGNQTQIDRSEAREESRAPLFGSLDLNALGVADEGFQSVHPVINILLECAVRTKIWWWNQWCSSSVGWLSSHCYVIRRLYERSSMSECWRRERIKRKDYWIFESVLWVSLEKKTKGRKKKSSEGLETEFVWESRVKVRSEWVSQVFIDQIRGDKTTRSKHID